MEWKWRKHVSRSSGKEMLAVTYYEDIFDTGITEYFPVLHEGFAGQKARGQIVTMSAQVGIKVGMHWRLEEIAEAFNTSPPPSQIEYTKDGKFYRVTRRIWNAEGSSAAGTDRLQGVAGRDRPYPAA